MVKVKLLWYILHVCFLIHCYNSDWIYGTIGINSIFLSCFLIFKKTHDSLHVWQWYWNFFKNNNTLAYIFLNIYLTTIHKRFNIADLTALLWWACTQGWFLALFWALKLVKFLTIPRTDRSDSLWLNYLYRPLLSFWESRILVHAKWRVPLWPNHQ